MNEMTIRKAELRVKQIKNAIAETRAKATSATKATAEMAIEMLALPELAKAEADLAEVKNKVANMDKFLNNPIFK